MINLENLVVDQEIWWKEQKKSDFENENYFRKSKTTEINTIL